MTIWSNWSPTGAAARGRKEVTRVRLNIERARSSDTRIIRLGLRFTAAELPSRLDGLFLRTMRSRIPCAGGSEPNSVWFSETSGRQHRPPGTDYGLAQIHIPVSI